MLLKIAQNLHCLRGSSIINRANDQRMEDYMEQALNSRLVELEALLRRHPAGLTSSELAESLGVDASTIRRYLARLSSVGVEIRKRGRRYHISFHRAARSLRLTPDEVLALYLACRLLSRQQS